MGFREDFVWGAATASYQVEGGSKPEERGRTVWDDFCTRPGVIRDGSDGYDAADHYHRYKEDVGYMKDIGLDAYRLSISWARLLPDGTGRINASGIKFYHNLFDEMISKGITPYVTLFHWDLPYELYSRGGWQNPDIVDWFAEYTELVAKEYGDKVKHFMTFNEPQCFVGIGHVLGIHAPGNLMSRRSVLTMAHNVLKAHGKAVQVLRANVKDAVIGYAPTSQVAIPRSNSTEDVELARRAFFDITQEENYMWNVTWWSDPIFFGKYPDDGLRKFEKDLPVFKSDDFKLISQPLDFYGQNIYHGHVVASDNNGGWIREKRPLGNDRTASGWPVVPESLYWGPKFLYERYNTPIFITENGISCTDTIAVDGRVHDHDRIDYLHRYLCCLRHAATDGVDLRGYFTWSLMDNFEWGEGYCERLGLIHVDYASFKRTLKDSAFWYRDVIKSNGEQL